MSTQVRRGQRGSWSRAAHWKWPLPGVGWEESGVQVRGTEALSEAGRGSTGCEPTAGQGDKLSDYNAAT